MEKAEWFSRSRLPGDEEQSWSISDVDDAEEHRWLFRKHKPLPSNDCIVPESQGTQFGWDLGHSRCLPDHPRNDKVSDTKQESDFSFENGACASEKEKISDVEQSGLDSPSIVRQRGAAPKVRHDLAASDEQHYVAFLKYFTSDLVQSIREALSTVDEECTSSQRGAPGEWTTLARELGMIVQRAHVSMECAILLDTKASQAHVPVQQRLMKKYGERIVDALAEMLTLLCKTLRSLEGERYILVEQHEAERSAVDRVQRQHQDMKMKEEALIERMRGIREEGIQERQTLVERIEATEQLVELRTHERDAAQLEAGELRTMLEKRDRILEEKDLVIDGLRRALSEQKQETENLDTQLTEMQSIRRAAQHDERKQSLESVHDACNHGARCGCNTSSAGVSWRHCPCYAALVRSAQTNMYLHKHVQASASLSAAPQQRHSALTHLVQSLHADHVRYVSDHADPWTVSPSRI